MPGRVHRKHIGCTCFQVWTPTASQLSILIMLPSESFLFIQGGAVQTFLFFQEWETLRYHRLGQHLIRKGLWVNSTASCPRGLLSLEVRQVLISSFSLGQPSPKRARNLLIAYPEAAPQRESRGTERNICSVSSSCLLSLLATTVHD